MKATDNIVQLPVKLPTAQQVLKDAAAENLKHVIVVGVTEDGENYFQCTDCSDLRQLVWLAFVAEDTVRRLTKGET